MSSNVNQTKNDAPTLDTPLLNDEQQEQSQSQKDLYSARKAYKKAHLTEDVVSKNPFAQFKQWYEEAESQGLEEPNAMVIATVDEHNAPNTRTVLLKVFDEKGFVFFTNYTSQKAKEIDRNPNVSIQFLWLGLERQVKIRGTAKRIALKESMHYFFARPKGSQIGAWVSHQSQVISSRSLLSSQYHKLKDKFMHGEVPFPDFWGGYRIEPEYFEFWQGGDNRLHDRIVYEPTESLNKNLNETSTIQDSEHKQWNIKRLAP